MGPIFHQKDAFRTSKNGVDMWIYNGKPECPEAAVAYQETTTGHAEEFRHAKSAFIFFIIEGSGEWVVEDETFPVRAHDVVIVPAGKKFHYRGNLKQVCITAPAWEAEFEEHVRDVVL
ncbi:MAG TPA: cupin domain-containing protein [Rhizomicrobium sp.]|jgi:mannose-6-phosphate isomerase-like protein (cupin superfamily)